MDPQADLRQNTAVKRIRHSAAAQCIDCTNQTGTFEISNESETTIEIVDIIGNIEFIGKGGVRTECTSEILNHDAPATLDPDQTVLVSYSLTCSDLCPDDTREVKNFIDVQIAGRDKLFHGSGSCFLVEDE